MSSSNKCLRKLYFKLFFKDPRMMVRQDLSAGEWQLIIKDVRYSDAGQYECQINTSPVLSHTLKLAVVGKCEDPWYHHLSIFPPLSWRVESAYNISLIILLILIFFTILKRSNKTINGPEFHNIISLSKYSKNSQRIGMSTNSLNSFSIVHSMNNE